MVGRPRTLLVLAPIVPAPTGNGLAMRVHLLVEATAALGGPVVVVVLPIAGRPPAIVEPGGAFPANVTMHVLALSGDDDRGVPSSSETAGVAELRWSERLARMAPLPAAVRSAPPHRAGEVLALVGEPVGGVLACRLGLAPLGLAVAEAADVALVVDADDDDVDLHRQVGDPAGAVTWDRVARTCLPGATLVTVAAERDVPSLADRGAPAPVVAVPNGVRVPDHVPAAPGRGRCVLVGNLTYQPNVDGARWFVSRVLPLLPPDVTLALVGPADDAVRRLAGPRVDVLGAVAEVGSHYARADLAVVPLRSGSGIRTKVLEAFAHRRPVVATTPGAAGLDVVDGRELRLADEPAAFARAVRQLLDPAQAAPLVDAAADLVVRAYDRRIVTDHAAASLAHAFRRRWPVPSLDAPRARGDLDLNEVPDGLVVYDGARDRVHYLNGTAAVVLALCTGDLDQATIASEVASVFRTDGPVGEEVAACLATFRAEGLLE